MHAHDTRHQGLNVLPASTAGLIALLARHDDAPLPSDRYVAVVTGNGLNPRALTH